MVQMIALQRMYVFSKRKEYAEGVTFDISDMREADSLARMKKAMLVPEKPKHVDLPKHVETKTEEPESDGPKKGAGRGRYQRRDMTATDGPTGEEISLPSSLLEPQPEEPISGNSEAAQES
jgi:hypothetical protein